MEPNTNKLIVHDLELKRFFIKKCFFCKLRQRMAKKVLHYSYFEADIRKLITSKKYQKHHMWCQISLLKLHFRYIQMR